METCEILLLQHVFMTCINHIYTIHSEMALVE